MSNLLYSKRNLPLLKQKIPTHMQTDSYTFANGCHFGKQKLKRKMFCFQLVIVFLILILSRYLLLAGGAEVNPGMSNSSKKSRNNNTTLKLPI